MLFYTGVERVSSTVLEEQKEKTHTNIEYLDKMVSLAKELWDDLINNKIEQVGDILHQGWLYKKKLSSNVTNSKINKYYDRAQKAGAVGGKILGAGGGGFLLLYCDEKYQNKVRETLGELQESPFKFELQGSKIIYVHD